MLVQDELNNREQAIHHLSLISPNCDLPSVFELKQNFAKYTFYGCRILIKALFSEL